MHILVCILKDNAWVEVCSVPEFFPAIPQIGNKLYLKDVERTFTVEGVEFVSMDEGRASYIILQCLETT